MEWHTELFSSSGLGPVHSNNTCTSVENFHRGTQIWNVINEFNTYTGYNAGLNSV